MSAPDFRRALVIRGGALGDFLLTLPVLAALRKAGPGARLEVLAYPGLAGLARVGGLADGIRSIEYGPLAGFFTRGAVLDPALREYFASFDFVLSYLYDPDGIFADNLRASGVRRMVAGPSRVSGTAHAIDQLASPLAELGIPLAERAVHLGLTPAKSAQPSVFLHPGSGSAAKNWAPENWRTLAARWLEEDPDLHLTILGGEADGAPLAALRGLAPADRVSWLENRPLPDLAAALAGGLLYLGHDTGISHLAACVGTPALLLFGPTDPDIWAPPHNHVRVLRAPEGKLDALSTGTVLRTALRLQELASGGGHAETLRHDEKLSRHPRGSHAGRRLPPRPSR